MGNIMDDGERMRWEEKMAKERRECPRVLDIGVGLHATREMGVGPEVIGALVKGVFDRLPDKTASGMVLLSREGRRVVLYVVRKGDFADVGNRKDFIDLGLGDICDKVDEQLRKEKGGTDAEAS